MSPSVKALVAMWTAQCLPHCAIWQPSFLYIGSGIVSLKTIGTMWTIFSFEDLSMNDRFSIIYTMSSKYMVIVVTDGKEE